MVKLAVSKISDIAMTDPLVWRELRALAFSMKIELLVVPDVRLRQRSKLIEKIDGYVRELAREMLAQLDIPIEGRTTIGFSAPQFGEMVRLIIVRLHGREIVLANPTIVRSVGKHKVIEACRSIPGKLYRVERPKVVKVKGMALDGSIKVVKGHDLLATCLYHETDHCDGIMIDRIGDMLTSEEV